MELKRRDLVQVGSLHALGWNAEQSVFEASVAGHRVHLHVPSWMTNGYGRAAVEGFPLESLGISVRICINQECTYQYQSLGETNGQERPAEGGESESASIGNVAVNPEDFGARPELDLNAPERRSRGLRDSVGSADEGVGEIARSEPRDDDEAAREIAWWLGNSNGA